MSSWIFIKNIWKLNWLQGSVLANSSSSYIIWVNISYYFFYSVTLSIIIVTVQSYLENTTSDIILKISVVKFSVLFRDENSVQIFYQFKLKNLSYVWSCPWHTLQFYTSKHFLGKCIINLKKINQRWFQKQPFSLIALYLNEQVCKFSQMFYYDLLCKLCMY